MAKPKPKIVDGVETYPCISKRLVYPSTWPEGQQRQLDRLFDMARAEGLWFYANGLAGEFWFTPDELQAQQDDNRFIWIAANWRLRSPAEAYQAAKEKERAAAQATREIASKIAHERAKTRL